MEHSESTSWKGDPARVSSESLLDTPQEHSPDLNSIWDTSVQVPAFEPKQTPSQIDEFLLQPSHTAEYSPFVSQLTPNVSSPHTSPHELARHDSVNSLIDEMSQWSDREEDNEHNDVDWLEKMQQIFSSYDTDNSGFLDESAFSQSLDDLAKLEPRLEGSLAGKRKELFNDLEENGLVKYQNLLDMFKQLYEQDNQDFVVSPVEQAQIGGGYADFPLYSASPVIIPLPGGEFIDMESEELENMDFEDEVREAFENEDRTGSGFIRYEQFSRIADKFGCTSKYVKEEYWYQYDDGTNKLNFDAVYDILDHVKKNPDHATAIPDNLTFENLSSEDFLTTLHSIGNPSVLRKIVVDMGEVLRAHEIKNNDNIDEEKKRIDAERIKRLEQERQNLLVQVQFERTERDSIVQNLQAEQMQQLRLESRKSIILQQGLKEREKTVRILQQKLSTANIRLSEIQSVAQAKDQSNKRLEETLGKLAAECEKLHKQLQKNKSEHKKDKKKLEERMSFIISQKEEQNELLQQHQEVQSEEKELLRKQLSDIQNNRVFIAGAAMNEASDKNAFAFRDAYTPIPDAPTLHLVDLDGSDGKDNSDAEIEDVDLVSDWDIRDVTDWLFNIDMGKYKDNFEANNVDGKALMECNQKILGEVGVLQTDMKIVLDEIHVLKEKYLAREGLIENAMCQNLLSDILLHICREEPRTLVKSVFHRRPLGFTIGPTFDGRSQVRSVHSAKYAVAVGHLIKEINGEGMYTKSHDEVSHTLENATLPMTVIFAKIGDAAHELRQENAQLKYEMMLMKAKMNKPRRFRPRKNLKNCSIM